MSHHQYEYEVMPLEYLAPAKPTRTVFTLSCAKPSYPEFCDALLKMEQRFGQFTHSGKQEYQSVGTNVPSNTGSDTLGTDRDGDYEMNSYSTQSETETTANINASSWSKDQQYSHKVANIPHDKRHDFSIRDWQWEFGFAIFSLGCFAAVIGVVAAYDTKPLSNWNFLYGINLNTVIAVLSTLSRTALMVPVASAISQLKWIHLVSAPRSLRDDASRGPWGSLELIWRVHIRAKLATWGAVITILSLAMGPFSQQLLSYPSKSITSGTSMFKSSHIYDTLPGVNRGPQRGVRTEILMGPKMQGAVLNGLYNLSSPIEYNCPTGNCAWDDFSTLAVTSNCQNVSSTSKVQCSIERATSCNYTTPSRMIIKSYYISLSSGGSGTFFNSTAFRPEQLSQSRLPKGGDPINGTIARFAMADMQQPFALDRPDIMECEMRMCAQVVRNMTAINGTFHPGVFEDIELESIPERMSVESEKKGWLVFKIAGQHSSFPGNRTFHVHWMDFNHITSFLYTTFALGSDSSSTSDTPLMNSKDRAQTIAAISQSMTYGFLDAASSENIEGKAMSDELYIRVHWPWIILPLMEVVMSIAFLLCTLILTYRKGVTVWKSSRIVALLTVLVGWDTQELTAPNWRELQNRSKHMHGQLVPNDADIQIFHRL